MSSRSMQSGVTLVELLIVVSIATILMAIGIPSYRYVTTANRISGEINALLGDMQFARYEAVKEGLLVTICPTSSLTGVTCDASSTWSEGWIVLSNSNAVLRRQAPFASDTLTSPSTVQSIIFNREGFATSLTGVVKFSLHDSTSNSGYTRCLMVGLSGMLATAKSGATVLGTVCS
jgi:type IV fimbrial biogenesis protein FimT